MEHGAPLQRRTTLSSCSRSAASVRRAGPMCPAAQYACFPSGGARGPRPTGHRPCPGGQSRPPLRRVKEPCETGRRTPRAFVPLRSTAGRRPLRAVAVPVRRAGSMCPAARYARFPSGGARGPRPTGHRPCSGGQSRPPLRRRTVCTSRRFDDGRAQKMCLYCAFRRTGSTI